MEISWDLNFMVERSLNINLDESENDLVWQNLSWIQVLDFVQNCVLNILQDITSLPVWFHFNCVTNHHYYYYYYCCCFWWLRWIQKGISCRKNLWQERGSKNHNFWFSIIARIKMWIWAKKKIRLEKSYSTKVFEHAK